MDKPREVPTRAQLDAEYAADYWAWVDEELDRWFEEDGTEQA